MSRTKIIIGIIFGLFVIVSVLLFAPEKDNLFDVSDQRGTSGVPIAFAASENPVIPLGDVAAVPLDLDIRGPQGEDVRRAVDVEVVLGDDDGYSLAFNSKKGVFKPGRYHVSGKVETSDGLLDFSQDFYWGVLAINTNKSIYTSGETARLALAVLDEEGDMVCDASLRLEIRNPKSEIRTLTTGGGGIVVNQECRRKEVTHRPDYETEFIVGDAGVYTMTLTAETANGVYTISDTFEVRESVLFDVERVTATRIYPVYPYEVRMNITVNDDFDGHIVETVPAYFEISPHPELGEYDRIELDGSVKRIIWEEEIHTYDSFSIGYTYKAPDISPEFYLLGPLALRRASSDSDNGQNDTLVFQEARRWQLAIDAIAYVQSTSQNALNSTTNVLAFTSNNTAGNLIVVSVAWNSTTETVSLSDSQGNTYQTAVGPSDGTATRGQTLYAENISAGANTITATFSGSVNSNLLIHEYSGIATSNSLDVTAASTGESTSCDSGAATTNQADELIFGACGAESNPTTMSAGTNFTKREDVNARTASQDRIVSTTGSYSSTITLGSSVIWVAQMATFKQASANNTPTITSATDSPDPVFVGNNVTFSIDWNDADSGENVKVKVCKTDSLTNQNCGGGFWATSTAFTTSDPETVTYTAQSGDVGTSPNSYYAFVCDDSGDCSSSSSGTFSAETNATPTITSVSDSPDPTNPNRSVTFTIDWNDTNSSETVKTKMCKTDSLTSQNCSGGFWASSTAFTTDDPIDLVYNVAGGDAGQTRSYYTFVCDDDANCSLSTSGTFSVNAVSTVPNVGFR